jgi:protein deglycase
VTMASADELEIHVTGGIRFFSDTLIADCLEIPYDLIALPVGIPGAMNLRDSEPLKALLLRQANENKYYAAICTSPAIVLHQVTDLCESGLPLAIPVLQTISIIAIFRN